MSEDVKEVKKKASKVVRYLNADEYSQEELNELSKLYSESFRDIKEGEIIQGKIVGLSGDNVVVDVGFKSDGTIPKTEFA